MGRFAGLIYVVILIMDVFFFNILEWLIPREDIDYVPEEYDWTQKRFEEYASVSSKFIDDCKPNVDPYISAIQLRLTV